MTAIPHLHMSSFKEKIAGSRKILVCNPTGLGDVVHTLPAARLIKNLHPDAQVDFLASAHAQDLFSLVPWIGRVFAVPEYPRPRSKLELYLRRLNVARDIRRERYDAIINFRAVDKTAMMVLMSGAQHRLALRWIRHRPDDWRFFYTDEVNRRWRNEASCDFMLASLADAGFQTEGYALGPQLLDFGRRATPAGMQPPYFHLSLFTSKESRQLKPEESRALIAGLLERYPGHRLVISCSAAPREVQEIQSLLPSGERERVTVCAGTLSTSELTLLMRDADAHIGPETGSLPLAWLAGCRTVSWFLNHETLVAWVPRGPQHRVIVSVCEQARLDSPGVSRPLQNIGAAHVLEALEDLLQGPRSAEQKCASQAIHFRFVY